MDNEDFMDTDEDIMIDEDSENDQNMDDDEDMDSVDYSDDDDGEFPFDIRWIRRPTLYVHAFSMIPYDLFNTMRDWRPVPIYLSDPYYIELVDLFGEQLPGASIILSGPNQERVLILLMGINGYDEEMCKETVNTCMRILDQRKKQYIDVHRRWDLVTYKPEVNTFHIKMPSPTKIPVELFLYNIKYELEGMQSIEDMMDECYLAAQNWKDRLVEQNVQEINLVDPNALDDWDDDVWKPDRFTPRASV